MFSSSLCPRHTNLRGDRLVNFYIGYFCWAFIYLEAKFYFIPPCPGAASPRRRHAAKSVAIVKERAVGVTQPQRGAARRVRRACAERSRDRLAWLAGAQGDGGHAAGAAGAAGTRAGRGWPAGRQCGRHAHRCARDEGSAHRDLGAAGRLARERAGRARVAAAALARALPRLAIW